MLTITLPFSLDALQIAMRRHMARPGLSVGDVVPARMGGGASGSPVYRLDVTYDGGLGDYTNGGKLSLVLKRGTQRTGAHLVGAARREARFYSTLASQLPVRTPRLLLTAENVTGEPASHLMVDAPGSVASSWGTEGEPDWVLMEAL